MTAVATDLVAATPARDDAGRQPVRIAPSLVFALAMSALCVLSGCTDPYADARARLSPTDLERFDRGARVAAPCAVCHDLAGTAPKIGPPLRGLAGRPVGGVTGFGYSNVFSSSTSRRWDARLLDAFLAEPQRVFPGNRMMSPGVPSAGARADLVFFLIEAGPVKER